MSFLSRGERPVAAGSAASAPIPSSTLSPASIPPTRATTASARRIAAGLTATFLLAAGPLMNPPSALAAEPAVGPTPPPGAVQSCLDSGDVWLVVLGDGVILANQCVGKPATGTAALEAAGVAIGRDGSGFICSLGNYPDPCPATFNGKYWQYYHATPSADWAYYEVGSDTSAPVGGTLEGWCYGETCTPPSVESLLVTTAVEAKASALASDAASAQAAAASAMTAAEDAAASAASQTASALESAASQAASAASAAAEASPVPVDASGTTQGTGTPWLPFAIGAAVVVIAAAVVVIRTVRRRGRA